MKIEFVKTTIFVLSICFIYSCSKEEDLNVSNETPQMQTSPYDDWWCYVLDWGASDPDDWCPPTSIYCDCGKAVVVTPNDYVGFSFHDNFNNSEFLAEFADSEDWENLFGSVLFEQNETHENIKNMLINQEYESVEFEDHNNVNYYVFKDAENDPIFSLRLIFEE